jgi:uncharacterized protein YbaR (Trm112 family)
MDKKYIEKIRCVKCGAEKMILYPITSLQEKIIEGLVCCLQCNTTYPIINEVPCFLLPEIRDEEIKVKERCYLDKYIDSKKQ